MSNKESKVNHNINFDINDESTKKYVNHDLTVDIEL